MATSLLGTRRDRLLNLCANLEAKRRVILLSNRGPLEYQLVGDGHTQARRSGGALVTAFSSLSNHIELTWIASATGEGDREMSRKAQGGHWQSPIPGQKLVLKFVVSPRKVYHKYFNIFCNPLLWFLHHYMWNSPYTPNIDGVVYDAWENGYVQVNQAFADAVVQEAANDLSAPLVMLQDYHLYLTGGYIREKLPQAIIQHFVHVPWPSPNYWQLLPAGMRTAICKSLCATDVLGFQTSLDVWNFLVSCEAFVENAQVDFANRTVQTENHLTRVNCYPASVDVGEIRSLSGSPRVAEYEKAIKPLFEKKSIVRIDRVEPCKNIVRGFRAFELLLTRHPELQGQVSFLAFLVPSRTHIKQFQRYLDEINAVVLEINSRFGKPDWRPIHTFVENNYLQAVAAMRLYDVLLANPVIDGMNLVAKEAPLVNTKNGVLVLSEGAGAHEQLANGVLSVAATDIEGTGAALYSALTMDQDRRSQLSQVLIRTIEEEDSHAWLIRQFEDVVAVLDAKAV